LQPTGPERGGEAVLADVIELVHSLRREGKELGVPPEAIGLDVAELVGTTGNVLSAATIQWSGIPIGERLSASAGLPVFVDADVRAAARGEAHFGAGAGLRSFLYVTVGTGISAALVIDGVPYAGARGLTGTFASSSNLIADHDGKLVSGPPLEEFAAGPALAERMAAAREGFVGAAPDVLALAEGGGTVAKSIVASAAHALGAAIAQLVNVLDPEAVVIGGGLGLAGGLYRESLEQALREHVWSDLHRDIPLFSAKLGNDAGVIGAAIGAAMSIANG
jgi:glucokinase